MYSKVGRENVRLFAAARPKCCSVHDGDDDGKIVPRLPVFSFCPAILTSVLPSSFNPPRCRVTPFEWQPPHPCIQEPTELESILSLHNCFWHNWGSVMQQGSDIAPA